LPIDLEVVHQVTEVSFGPGALDSHNQKAAKSSHILFAKRSKKVLKLSLRESLRLGHKDTGIGHMLLGLLSEGGGLAVQMPMARGVSLPELRDEVTSISPEAA
jgi:ATP-dependent Clp protease ATP-binding subunit ClpA